MLYNLSAINFCTTQTMPNHDTDSSALHAHRQGDAHHQHYFESRQQSILAWAVACTLFFAAVEAVTGWLANSLALISDAGHMITDSAALGLALMAQYLSKRPPNARLSYGFARAEALAAFVNGLAMLLVIIWIAKEAIARLWQPEPVAGGAVAIVAVIGLLVNIVVAWLLAKDNKSVNTRAALVHVMGDLLGSVAAIVAGVVIYYTGWLHIDPILSLLVSVLILRSTLVVIKDSYHFLMEGVPGHIDYVQVGLDISKIDGVLAVHDLHVWEMSPGHSALTGHIEIAELASWPRILSDIKAMLLSQHNIDHITLQAELQSNDTCAPDH